MNRRKFIKTVPAAALLATSGDSLIGSSIPELKPIALPNPDKEGGMAVMSCISQRKTTRTISSKEIREKQPGQLVQKKFLSSSFLIFYGPDLV